MEVDLRTPSEKAREEKHERIVNMFLSLSAEQPDAAPHRIFLAIANELSNALDCTRLKECKHEDAHNNFYQTVVARQERDILPAR